MKRLVFAAFGIAVVVGFVLGASWYKNRRAEQLGFMAQENASTFVRPHSPTYGPEDAKVVLVEFTDPACETCAAFSPIVKQFIAAHPGKIRFVLRYAPFHHGADFAMRALEAARVQDKFWETLDLLYRSQQMWTQHHQVIPDRVWQILPMAGLDVERLRTDMADPRIDTILQQDLADAELLGVRKTPGFFVNGKPLEPFGDRQLKALIDAEVRLQYPE
jgi:protein-disulfide isomerase